MWWLSLAIFAAFTVVGELLRPKLQKDKPQPSSLGDFQAPTVDGGRAIPYAFGTVLAKGPNVTWYGDLQAVPIKKKVKTGLFSSETLILGYRYFLGMQLALCQGAVDVFRGIRFEEKIPTFTTSTVGDKLRIDMGGTAPIIGGSAGLISMNPNLQLFGGQDGDGGVAGLIDFHYGTSSQAQNDYLQSILGTNIPAFRDTCYAVMRHAYVGNSPYLKNVAFEFSRYPNGLGLTSSHHIVATYDANPACVLYEILTSGLAGVKIPSGLIDLTTWQAVGDALFAEGFGVSALVDSQQSARELVDEILRHIDGVIYSDLSTGLVKIVLARADYDPLTLPTLNESMIVDFEMSRPSWPEISNTIQIAYVSRADNYQRRTVPWQNLAAVQLVDDRLAEEIPFLLCSRAAVADMLAARVGKTLSYPLARIKLKVNRAAYNYLPGKVFKLNWPPEGIVGMICRVSFPEYGDLEDGLITLQCVEDIFGIATTSYVSPGGSGWTDPIGAIAAPLAQRMIEAPYHLVGGPDRHALIAAVRASGGDLGFEIWSDRAGGTAYALTGQGDAFCPSGLLQSLYPANTAATDATGFVITSPTDASALATISAEEFAGGINLLLVDDEIMAFRTVTDNLDGTWTISNIMRGALDTVPAQHSSSTRVYFVMPPGFAVVDPSNPYGADGTVTAKALPFNTRAILPIASATAMSLTTASRALKPYPPGNVKIAGTAWPTSVTGGVDIPVTWAHRHRVTQTTDLVVVAQDAGDYVATPEGNYTVVIRVGGVIKRTAAAIAGTTYTWLAADQVTDGATVGASVSIRVYPVNGALTGTYQERTFTIA